MPQLYQLKAEVENLIKALCLDFTDIFKTDLSRKDKQLPLSQVYLGILATNTMHTIKAECGDKDPGIPLTYSQCREFLIEAVKQIKERISDCHKLHVLSCFSPATAYNLRIPYFSGLYRKMPFLSEVVDQEW